MFRTNDELVYGHELLFFKSTVSIKYYESLSLSNSYLNDTPYYVLI